LCACVDLGPELLGVARGAVHLVLGIVEGGGVEASVTVGAREALHVEALARSAHLLGLVHALGATRTLGSSGTEHRGRREGEGRGGGEEEDLVGRESKARTGEGG